MLLKCPARVISKLINKKGCGYLSIRGTRNRSSLKPDKVLR